MKVVYAVVTASVTMPGGYPLLIQKGTHWPADDPLVLDRPDLFSEDARYGMSYSQQQPAEDRVEQMTAAPGERRRTTRPSV